LKALMLALVLARDFFTGNFRKAFREPSGFFAGGQS
jgi:hypothetical protein